MRSTTAELLLHRFYQTSFLNVLGIRLPLTAFSFRHFQAWAIDNLDEVQRQMLEQGILVYQRQKAPGLKAEPLLRYLSATGLPIRSLLDFGCGTGRISRYLASRLPSLERIVGVDTDRSVLPDVVRIGNADADWLTDLSSLRQNEQFDMIAIVHTLHHVHQDAQVSLLAQLAQRLRSGGVLYLVEDSWDEARVARESNVFDRVFNALPTELKRSVFRKNDDISNNWFYQRDLPVDDCWYRSMKEWTMLLDMCGLIPVSHDVVGFKSDRLHGVPNGWIIARRE